MSRGLTFLIAFVVAYVIARALYWASGFKPIREFGLPLGYMLDLALWAVLFLGVVWALGRIWPPVGS
jgi:hypothetical protein